MIPPPVDLLVYGDRAVQLGPAVPVARGPFNYIGWSPNGRFLCAAEHSDEPDAVKLVIARSDGTIISRLTIPGRFTPSGLSNDGTAWFYRTPQTPAEGPNTTLIAVVRGQAISQTVPVTWIPLGPMAEGDFGLSRGHEITFLTPSGQTTSLQAPGKSITAVDGTLAVFDRVPRGGEFLNRKSGAWSPYKFPAPSYDVRTRIAGELTVARLSSEVKLPEGATPKGPTDAMICGDVTRAELAPTRDAVAYISRGALLIRPISAMSLEDAVAAWLNQQKRELLMRAKTLGVGALLLAADSDDVLPGNWMDMLDPYLRDSGLKNGFVATFGGGDIAKIDRPSETILGFISGPGGRAVVYLDGHAAWEPAPR